MLNIILFPIMITLLDTEEKIRQVVEMFPTWKFKTTKSI